jgi:hypothetical protein
MPVVSTDEYSGRHVSLCMRKPIPNPINQAKGVAIVRRMAHL